jgi:hypothetical protein
VQIDGNAASTLSTFSGGAASADQCIPSPIFNSGPLAAAAHQVIVKNGMSADGSKAGTLEFNGLTYVCWEQYLSFLLICLS